MKSLGDFLYGASHFKHCQNACPLVVTYLVEWLSFLLFFLHSLSSFQEGKTAEKRIPKKGGQAQIATFLSHETGRYATYIVLL